MKRTALAQLVAMYAQHLGVTSTKQLADATGYSERAIRKAKAELGCRNQSADGTIVPELGCHERNYSAAARARVSYTEVNIKNINPPTPLEGGEQGDLPIEPKPDQVQQAFDAYNNVAKAHKLPTARKLGEDLRRKIGARLKDDGLDGWLEMLDIVTRSPHLLGKSKPRDGGEPFRANLDWLAGPQNYSKVVNGLYEKEGINGEKITKEELKNMSTQQVLALKEGI